MSPKLSLRQLEYLTRVASAGSMRKAAGSLGVSQPAVTQAMKELETALGVELFARSGSGVSLTSAGHLFSAHAANALSQIMSGVQEVRDLRKDADRRLNIAGPTVGSSRIVSRAVARFKKRFPHTAVMLNSSENRPALDGLQAGEVDIYFGRAIAHEEFSKLRFEPLFQDRLVIVAGRKDTVRSGTSDLRGFLDHPWVIPTADTRVSDAIHDVFRTARVPLPRNYVEMNVGDPLWEYMNATGSLGILPSNLVAQEIQSERLYLIGADANWILPEVGFAIVRRSQPKKSISDFVQELRRCATQRRNELRRIWKL